jgi:hypothetical protein
MPTSLYIEFSNPAGQKITCGHASMEQPRNLLPVWSSVGQRMLSGPSFNCGFQSLCCPEAQEYRHFQDIAAFFNREGKTNAKAACPLLGHSTLMAL